MRPDLHIPVQGLFCADLTQPSPSGSEASSCQVCKLVSLQNLNFKLGRDCKVPEGREQERCLRDRGPGGWASGGLGASILPTTVQCVCW